MDHVGIDVHKRESQIGILTPEGEMVERRIQSTRQHFTKWFAGRARARVLLEAATESEWVAQTIEQCGHEVIVADPNYAPARHRVSHPGRVPIGRGRRARISGSGVSSEVPSQFYGTCVLMR